METNIVKVGKLKIDTELHQVTYRNRVIPLTMSETAILEALGTKYKKGYIKHTGFNSLEPVKNLNREISPLSCRVLLSRIQKKLRQASKGKDYIYCFIGYGYALKDPDEHFVMGKKTTNAGN